MGCSLSVEQFATSCTAFVADPAEPSIGVDEGAKERHDHLGIIQNKPDGTTGEAPRTR